MPSTDILAEARRSMEICNACRYCEGYCAVFPAMEMRRAFTDGDLSYLANLCHNCKGCWHACQYAPPHEFGLNVPKTFSSLRVESWRDHAWPAPLAGLFHRNGIKAVLATALGLAGFLIASALLVSPERLFGLHEGDFYAIVPHNVMVATFGAVFLFAILAMIMSVRDFIAASGEKPIPLLAWARAMHDAATLKNLGGAHGPAGDEGCHDIDDRASNARRRYHHLTAGGFLLCFASTSLGTIYHYVFGWEAPYPLTSPVVILGTVGGIGLLVGPLGLLRIKYRTDRAPEDLETHGLDIALLASLFFVSLTGLLLLAFRDMAAMGILLIIHLGFVMGLFLVLPYGKFVHGLYRLAALARSHEEKMRG